MPVIIYSCQACKTTLFAQEEDLTNATEIWAGSDYCQACADAINKHFPPESTIANPTTERPLRCVACMDHSEVMDAPGWRHHDKLKGMCCPSCLAAEEEGYLLSDYYAIDLFTEQNAMDAYDSHRQHLADSHDRAASDTYHGRD